MAKKIWARIGISCFVTDEEYEYLLNQSRCEHKTCDGETYFGYSDVTLSDEMAAKFMIEGELDGDSYIPDIIFAE